MIRKSKEYVGELTLKGIGKVLKKISPVLIKSAGYTAGAVVSTVLLFKVTKSLIDNE